MKGLPVIKAKPWNGKDLKGTWTITLKIDGVRAMWSSEGWLSRAGKPLYNIPMPFSQDPRDCEVYLGSFKDTIRAVRTKNPKWDTPKITRHHLYGLDPLDDRLLGLPYRNAEETIHNPDAATIRKTLEAANRLGYEGLVLRQAVPGGSHGDSQVWLKVKPEETHDVLITGAVEGEGKHTGRLGALQTAKGDVGTGFTDDDREFLWNVHRCAELVGSTIEVSCMQFTPDGKFRHPRFVRLRPDKIAAE